MPFDLASATDGNVIVGIGVDLVDIARIERLLRKFPARAKAKIFTAAERQYCEASRSPLESFAARFAAKEAYFKAVGTGWSGGVSWKDVEVLREGGAPFLRISGEAAGLAAALGVVRMHLTLSHTVATACAFVVLEGKTP